MWWLGECNVGEGVRWVGGCNVGEGVWWVGVVLLQPVTPLLLESCCSSAVGAGCGCWRTEGLFLR